MKESDTEILISIIGGANRPENISNYIIGLESKAAKPGQIEVLFSVDEGDQATIDAIKTAAGNSRMSVKYFEGARQRGYFEGNKQYNKILLEIAATTKFIGNFSDKVYFTTDNWDEKLLKYHDIFEDGVIRVRITRYKYVRSYPNMDLAMRAPDNFAFYSRKLIELMGGFGDNWGPDSWAEAIMYTLEMTSTPYQNNFRNVPAYDISTGDYIYSSIKKQTDPEKIDYTKKMNLMIEWAFKFMSYNPLVLENFYRIAATIELYITDFNEIRGKKYQIIYNNEYKAVVLLNEKGEKVGERSYRMPIKLLMHHLMQTDNLREVYNIDHIRQAKPFKINKLIFKEVTLFYRRLRRVIKFIVKDKQYETIVLEERGDMKIVQNQYIEGAIEREYKNVYETKE